MNETTDEALLDLRRDLHRHPEPAWREFYTTARLVSELETRDIDALYVGDEVFASERPSVPDADSLERWVDRAEAAGAREDLLDRLRDQGTGLMAVLERGEGPTVALRVDIDALPIVESDDETHLPAREGFRSENEGFMHACGHDVHATVGVGVIDAIVDSDFAGTLKVLFQPAEEQIAGGEPAAEGGRFDDVDYLLALHVGLGHPSGEVVAGVDGFLAVSEFRADFSGAAAHAGQHPSAGRHAVQAMATAVQNLHAIPRHEDGATRVNAGHVGGGTASNVVPESAFLVGEVRGETTDLMAWMKERAVGTLEAAAAMHGCEVTVEERGRAPSAESDDAVAAVVGAVASEVPGVDSVLDSDDLGGSEDATYLMRHVQARGGKAAYVTVGTDHPGGHHTPTFDVDEATIPVAVDVLAGTIRELARARP